MKLITALLLIILPLLTFSQNSDYDIHSFKEEGTKAPNVHHLGEAWLNMLIQADDEFNYNITQATFSPNATLDWHMHTTPQIIIVLEGEGYYQERGKDPIIMRTGDVIKCEKGVEHWHTSSAHSKVSYLAIYGEEPTIWTEKLTREYYDSVAKTLEKK